ncbi:lysylphosphatidylglycerol synthase transmembrane domain-containing protein [Nakamurella endophytica]|uniref:Uncharacterized protein n=1 Tax=Nakamurella endophytica TaxID=1748367 RepID=A0A917WAW3_9ACTN|nr:YbhN family protein [Nakamurella endophytica]GGL89760.1 hypothetical protein GCM10011594_06710 [Nakamurella endophytica]
MNTAADHGTADATGPAGGAPAQGPDGRDAPAPAAPDAAGSHPWRPRARRTARGAGPVRTGGSGPENPAAATRTSAGADAEVQARATLVEDEVEREVEEELGDAGRPHRRPWWQHALRLAALVVVAVVVVAVLRDKVPSPHEVLLAFRTADWGWVVAAFVLQLASIGMLIRQQRRLLRAFGVPVPLSRVFAITYSSTAISMSMPAGSALGAGYSYRQYRKNGASAATAAAVLLLSGVLSLLALILLYLIGLGLSASGRIASLGGDNPVLAVVLGVLVVAVIVGAAVWLSRRSGRIDPRPPATPRLDRWGVGHPRTAAVLRQVLLTGRRAARVEPHDWRLALLTSALNWGLDLACLWASCLAFEIDLNLFRVALIYLGVQVIRQIPITPGGVGVIEASLLAALVAAGAANAPAAAAVLVYRLFAAWMIIPIGFVMLALLRRRPGRRES